MIGVRPAARNPDTLVPADRGLLQEQVRDVVSNLPPSVLQASSSDGPAVVRILAIGEERFRLVVDLLPPGRNGDRLPIMTVERVADHDISEHALRDRYRLTRRESVVALLLARRRSNAEIAEELRISPHTARRHTENVMLKLNVTSRYSVGDALRDGLGRKPH